MTSYLTIGFNIVAVNIRCHFVKHESMLYDMLIDLSKMIECNLITNDSSKKLNIGSVRSILKKMDKCQTVYANSVANGKNKLQLKFSNGTEKIISISNSGHYLGYYSTGNCFSYWYYYPLAMIGNDILDLARENY